MLSAAADVQHGHGKPCIANEARGLMSKSTVHFATSFEISGTSDFWLSSAHQKLLHSELTFLPHTTIIFAWTHAQKRKSNCCSPSCPPPVSGFSPPAQPSRPSPSRPSPSSPPPQKMSLHIHNARTDHEGKMAPRQNDIMKHLDGDNHETEQRSDALATSSSPQVPAR